MHAIALRAEKACEFFVRAYVAGALLVAVAMTVLTPFAFAYGLAIVAR